MSSANVLIALVVTDHVHHDMAEEWFENCDDSFATCPITEGSLLRLLIREGQSAIDAQTVLDAVKAGSFLPLRIVRVDSGVDTDDDGDPVIRLTAVSTEARIVWVDPSWIPTTRAHPSSG